MRRTSRRTLIEPDKGDKRHVRRKQKKQVKTEVSAGRALAIDPPHKAKNEASTTLAIEHGKHFKPSRSRRVPRTVTLRETKSRHAVKRDSSL